MRRVERRNDSNMNRRRRGGVCLLVSQHTDVPRCLLKKNGGLWGHVGVVDGCGRAALVQRDAAQVQRGVEQTRAGEPGTAVEEGAGIHRDASHHTAPEAIGQGSGGCGGDGKAHRQARGRSQSEAEGQADAWEAAGNAERRPGA